MSIFEGRGLVVGELTFLSPREAHEILTVHDGLLVDLREDYLVAMKRFLVPAVVYMPHHDFAALSAGLPRDRPLVLADSAGVYTKAAAGILREQGYAAVACLNGGMLAWDEAGMPVETDRDALLHGDCACVMRPRDPG